MGEGGLLTIYTVIKIVVLFDTLKILFKHSVFAYCLRLICCNIAISHLKNTTKLTELIIWRNNEVYIISFGFIFCTHIFRGIIILFLKNIIDGQKICISNMSHQLKSWNAKSM